MPVHSRSLKSLLSNRANAFLPVAVLLLLATMTFSFRFWQRFRAWETEILVGRNIIEHTSRMLVALVDAETGQRGFLLTGQDEYLEPYLRGSKEAPAELSALLSAVAPFEGQRTRAEAINELMTRKLNRRSCPW